jgi:hypothetical protein
MKLGMQIENTPNKAAIHFNVLKISLDLLQIKLHPLAYRCFTSNIVVAVFSSHEYNRYHRFAAEESVLQSGGVLCPQPGNHLRIRSAYYN